MSLGRVLRQSLGTGLEETVPDDLDFTLVKLPPHSHPCHCFIDNSPVAARERIYSAVTNIRGRLRQKPPLTHCCCILVVSEEKVTMVR